MRHLLIYMVLIFAIGCQDKTLTIAELEKIEWKVVKSGVSYFSLKESNEKFKHVKVFQIDSTAWETAHVNAEIIDSMLTEIVKGVLLDTLQKTSKGYIRLNIAELLNSPPKVIIYLRDQPLDSTLLSQEIARLRTISGVENVEYVTKDDAKRIWLEEGNTNWENVLDENPLPESIVVTIQTDSLSKQLIDFIDDRIRSSVINFIDINLPRLPTTHEKRFHYFHFERIL